MRSQVLNFVPHFAPLHPGTLQDISRVTSQFETYSDFNLVSMLCWDIDGSLKVHAQDGLVILSMHDYLTNEPVYSLMGSDNIDEAIRFLLRLSPRLKLVPEDVVQQIKDRRGLRIEEDHDNFDYVYSTEALATLSGGVLKKKRNKVNKVLNDLGGTIQTSHVRTLTERQKTDMLHLFDLWAQENQSAPFVPTFEREALRHLCTIIGQFDFIFTLVYQGDHLVGFSVNELVDDKTAVCHFEKAISIHKYFCTYLTNAAAKALYELGIETVNWEQDLGILTLRSAKTGYQPIKYLKKYTIAATEV